MLKIYIVDDEPMAVRYLADLLETIGYASCITGSQTNSLKAWAEIRKSRPDIVFVDISMPVMNGLELAEKILKNTNARVYLLTSYEDFEYAKKGVRIGVSDYLLKNELSESMLGNLLEKAEHSILSEKKQRHLVLEHNIRDFLLGQSLIEKDLTYHEREGQRYVLLSFYPCMPIDLVDGRPAEEDLQVDCYSLQNTVCPEGMTCSAFARIRSYEYCAVIFISAAVVDSGRLLQKTAELFLDEIRKSGRDWKCICSDVKLHFFELQEAYRRNKGAAGYLYQHERQSFFRIGDIILPQETEDRFESDLEELGHLIRERRRDEILSKIEALFNVCRTYDTFDRYILHMRSFWSFISRQIRREGMEIQLLDASTVYASPDDLERTLIQFFRDLLRQGEGKTNGAYSDYVLKAIEYIRLHYMEDISVADIVEEIKISEGHLRRLFRQELGMSIIDYLTDYRIGRAKILLRDPKVPAAGVWSRTGFSSAQYFSYVFRKKEGLSPREYQRKQI